MCFECQCRNEEALHSFAQDTYHCSLAYGPLDVRTSLAYYNLAKVFEGMDEADKTLACCDQVLSGSPHSFVLVPFELNGNFNIISSR